MLVRDEPEQRAGQVDDAHAEQQLLGQAHVNHHQQHRAQFEVRLLAVDALANLQHVLAVGILGMLANYALANFEHRDNGKGPCDGKPAEAHQLAGEDRNRAAPERARPVAGGYADRQREQQAADYEEDGIVRQQVLHQQPALAGGQGVFLFGVQTAWPFRGDRFGFLW